MVRVQHEHEQPLYLAKRFVFICRFSLAPTANLEKVRQSLANGYAQTVRESEKQMRMLQQERQAVFQDAFQSDLQYYKEVGKIPSKQNDRSTPFRVQNSTNN